MKNKIIFGIGFLLFLVLVWVVTYKLWLGVEPKGDNVITRDELEEYDNRQSIFYEAEVKVGDTVYQLADLNKEILGSNIVVEVKVNERKVQGYVTFSDTVDKPEVKLADEDTYAQIILPEKGEE